MKTAQKIVLFFPVYCSTIGGGFTFASAEEAGEFWDSHSTSDYEEYMEPVDMTIDIKERHYEIEVDKETFFALNVSAKKAHKSVKSFASNILNKKLAAI